jgi:predicted NBD/HSP70 family sugar kinase
LTAQHSSQDLRRHNRDRVLRFLLNEGSGSRAEIAHRTGLTPAAISRIVRELIDTGLVEECGGEVRRGQAGRRQVRLAIAAEGAYALGVSVTMNARNIVLANSRGQILYREDASDIPLTDAEHAIDAFAERCLTLIERADVPAARLIGGAVSVAGRIDPETGEIGPPGPLSWRGLKIAELFERKVGIPFTAEGRAAALLLGEQRSGVAAGTRNALLLNIGHSIGAALLLDGQLIRGHLGRAADIAHYRLPECQRKCLCGAFGCLDACASGIAVLERLRENGAYKGLAEGQPVWAVGDAAIELRSVLERRREEGSEVDTILFDAGFMLGRAITALAPILAPEVVVLAGFLSRNSSYVDGVRESVDSLCEPDRSRCPIRIVTSHLTTAQSAVSIALHRFLFSTELDIARL